MTYAPINAQTAFLPIEFDFPLDEKLTKELISKRERLTATIVNVREIAQYELRELLTGKQWFNTQTSQAYSFGATRQPRYGFRTVVDLVALNGGNIPNGTTTLVLTANTIPQAISGYNIPLPSGGSATDTNGKSYFLNDMNISVTFTGSTNTITIVNNTGLALSQFYFVFEYLKQ